MYRPNLTDQICVLQAQQQKERPFGRKCRFKTENQGYKQFLPIYTKKVKGWEVEGGTLVMRNKQIQLLICRTVYTKLQTLTYNEGFPNQLKTVCTTFLGIESKD